MIRNPHIGNARVRAVASRLYAASTILATAAESMHSFCTPDDCRVARGIKVHDLIARYVDDDDTGALQRADALLAREGVNLGELIEDA